MNARARGLRGSDRSPYRVHVFGASGAGTTTLARALADDLAIPAFDVDDYFWVKTDPPFREIRPRAERVKRLLADLRPCASWTLSGSMVGWDQEISPAVTLVVYLWVPPEVRMARLAERERSRYGAQILPGGSMHDASAAFMQWAAAYDTAGAEQRSRELHRQWLAGVKAPVLRIEGETSVARRVSLVKSALGLSV
jgi:adenylate kinase family enzyme